MSQKINIEIQIKKNIDNKSILKGEQLSISRNILLITSNILTNFVCSLHLIFLSVPNCGWMWEITI